MKLAFVINKPKAKAIAERMRYGAEAANVRFRVVQPGDRIEDDEVGVFYGVVPATRNQFKACLERRSAVYLDNGWLSRRGETTLRWAWNGVQAHHLSLQKRPEELARLGWGDAPIQLDMPPERARRALVVLQSPNYLANFGNTLTRETWIASISERLREKGYGIKWRQKPTKEKPELRTIDADISEVGLVVSLNSAATVRALHAGVPVFNELDCTIKPMCQHGIPYAGHAEAPPTKQVSKMLAKLAWGDFTYGDLASGKTVKRIVKTPEHLRKGILYDGLN